MAYNDAVKDFFVGMKLEDYVAKVVELGYDDIDQLISLENEDLTSFLELSGLQAKQGHKQRFLAGVPVLTSERTHGKPEENQPKQNLANLEKEKCMYNVHFIIKVINRKLRLVK